MSTANLELKALRVEKIRPAFFLTRHGPYHKIFFLAGSGSGTGGMEV
jgi:hypothetical protein